MRRSRACGRHANHRGPGRRATRESATRAVIAAEALLEATLHIEVEAPGRLRPDWGIAVRALIPAVTGDQVPARPLCGSGAPPRSRSCRRSRTHARISAARSPSSQREPLWAAGPA